MRTEVYCEEGQIYFDHYIEYLGDLYWIFSMPMPT